jgi:hypothetical protein
MCKRRNRPRVFVEDAPRKGIAPPRAPLSAPPSVDWDQTGRVVPPARFAWWDAPLYRDKP